MADIYELMLAVDLCDDVSEDELAELQWHLGLGPRPGALRIVTGFPCVVEDDHGELAVEDHPEPLLGCHGEASMVEGVLVSVLVRRQDTRRGAWAVTSRQEIHPDGFERTGELLAWLAGKAGDGHRRPDGSVEMGWTRFYEERRPEPLVVRDGVVVWPS
ncbi:hypothetical protein STRCI_000047 [Streptomyces cinnabarinus]|uniref:DUF4265 domain-containing protein n=1 Tax=Streptomyces cinnabarinus TaxID=67287 RepID=A0ABY7K4G4_9ACTN|nr:hypothetical protein [Streptomyces cinnabarinus]WAZ19028.1 hypothetical protein STRCI_000047 [Streptomyces cinnabarinus]